MNDLGQFVSASSSTKCRFYKRYFFISLLPHVNLIQLLNLNKGIEELGSGKVDSLKLKFSDLMQVRLGEHHRGRHRRGVRYLDALLRVLRNRLGNQAPATSQGAVTFLFKPGEIPAHEEM